MFDLECIKSPDYFKRDHARFVSMGSLAHEGDFLFLHKKCSAKRSFERENHEMVVILGVVFAAATIAAVYFFGMSSILLLCFGVVMCFYLFSLLFKVFLVCMALAKKMPSPTKKELCEISDDELPSYTVLVPLYKEGGVLKEFIEHFKTIDYPKGKLDVRLLLEADDEETQNAARALRLKKPFSIVIVPITGPRTKPKALNAGILGSKGEIVTIYDAEDKPDRDQLRKVAWAFRHLPAHVVCVQAKLTFHNAHQNIMTKWFFSEYFTWFNYFLPGLSILGLPVPLGGTSNHFKLSALKKIGAWDPYNVTEDADLGIRISRLGYKIATIDSSSERRVLKQTRDGSSIAIIETTTVEEANSVFLNWFRQRTRWVKGYIQTSLVHLRNPAQALRDMSLKGFLSFIFFISGTPVANLLNLLMWTITALWLLDVYAVLPDIISPELAVLGFISFAIGNALFMLLHLIPMVAQRKWSVALVTLFIPIYWLMMSLASVRAAWQLMTNPHYWEKTLHGIARKEPPGVRFAETALVALFLIFTGFSANKFYGVVLNASGEIMPSAPEILMDHAISVGYVALASEESAMSELNLPYHAPRAVWETRIAERSETMWGIYEEIAPDDYEHKNQLVNGSKNLTILKNNIDMDRIARNSLAAGENYLFLTESAMKTYADVLAEANLQLQSGSRADSLERPLRNSYQLGNAPSYDALDSIEEYESSIFSQ